MNDKIKFDFPDDVNFRGYHMEGEYNKLTRFERFCLWFIKTQYENVQTVDKNRVVSYKIFKNKKYIISEFADLPRLWNCRHHIEPLDTVLDIGDCKKHQFKIKDVVEGWDAKCVHCGKMLKEVNPTKYKNYAGTK